MVSEMVRVESVLNDSVAVRTDTHNNIVIETNVVEDEVVITPLDTAKEMKVDGKSYKNVVITKKTKKDTSTSTNKSTTHKDSTSQAKGRTISLNLKDTSIDISSKEREEPQMFYMYSFGFILLLLLLYFIYRKLTS